MGLRDKLSDLFNLGELKDAVISLIEAKFELKKIEILEKSERAIADLLYYMIFALIASIALVFILILAAFGLNKLLGEPYGTLLILILVLICLLIYHAKRYEVKAKLRERIQKEIDL